MDTADLLEQTIAEVLQHLHIPIEIAKSQTCFGKTYYEWTIATKNASGISLSFPEAIQEALNRILKGSKQH